MANGRHADASPRVPEESHIQLYVCANISAREFFFKSAEALLTFFFGERRAVCGPHTIGNAPQEDPPRKGGMRTRRGQKTSLLLVVTGGPRCVLLPCVRDSVASVWKIHSRHDLYGQQQSLIPLRLGYDPIHSCHSVISCGCR